MLKAMKKRMENRRKWMDAFSALPPAPKPPHYAPLITPPLGSPSPTPPPPPQPAGNGNGNGGAPSSPEVIEVIEEDDGNTTNPPGVAPGSGSGGDSPPATAPPKKKKTARSADEITQAIRQMLDDGYGYGREVTDLPKEKLKSLRPGPKGTLQNSVYSQLRSMRHTINKGDTKSLKPETLKARLGGLNKARYEWWVKPGSTVWPAWEPPAGAPPPAAQEAPAAGPPAEDESDEEGKKIGANLQELSDAEEWSSDGQHDAKSDEGDDDSDYAGS